MRTVRLRISGRVQGVGYRAWMIATATRLGLSGWVRNRLDGSVEALVSGDDGTVEAMVALCGDGPYGARVTAVAVDDDQADGSTGFGARPTA
jgi:acylphosphatase